MLTKNLRGVLRQKKGFTLMELVIVIAILAILVTLALLYYGNLTNDTDSTALLADLNAVDKAITLYESKYATFPTVGNTADLSAMITAVGTDAADLPTILSQAGFVNVKEVSAANTNFLEYIKKTRYLLKPGMESGDNRGAGKLYYVESVTEIANGTAQAGGAATEIILAAATAQADDYFNGAIVYITGGTGAGQSREISDYTGATDIATVSPAWETNPDATSTYSIMPPVKKGDVVFLQSTTVEENEIKDANSKLIYKY